MRLRYVLRFALSLAAITGVWLATCRVSRAEEPRYRVAERLTPTPNTLPDLITRQPNEHPLAPAIRWARTGLTQIEQVQDYSATLVKRERIDGQLGEAQHMFIKVRHEPFSVYLNFLGPSSVKGQEVIFIEGRNDGQMWAHGTGYQRMLGTLSLDPNGLIAMRGNKYPITEIGLANLLRRLVAIGEREMQYGECDVRVYRGAKLNDRLCTCLEFAHPVPRKEFLYNVARIFIDDELNLPIRFESYDWPEKPGGKPQLNEEYTYLNLTINNGYTDADFDIANSEYKFK